MRMETPKRGWGFRAVQLLISGLILFAVVRLLGEGSLQRVLREVNPWYLLPISLILGVSVGLRSLRFTLLINARGRILTFWQSLNMSLVGEALNMVIPASGGHIARAYYGYRQHGAKEEMWSTAFLDKLIAVQALLVLGLLAAALNGFTELIVFFGVLAIPVSAAIFFPGMIPWGLAEGVLRRIRFRSLDISRLRSCFSASIGPKTVAFGVSIIAWLFTYAHLYLVIRMFGYSMEPLFLLTSAPLMNLSRLFPLTWSGLGIQEGVAAYFFAIAGIPASASITISLAFTVTTLVLPALVGFVLLLRMR